MCVCVCVCVCVYAIFLCVCVFAFVFASSYDDTNRSNIVKQPTNNWMLVIVSPWRLFIISGDS
jgi:hypothetical protein